MISVTDPGSNGLVGMSSVWAVMEAARAGAADARTAADGFFPAVSRALSSGIYATGFAVGYAVTFPALLTARVVPASNPVVFGLTDGGRAGLDLARSSVRPSISDSSASVGAPALAVASL
ncbi:MAG: hypothetical protein RLZZ440_828 [Planctomycetota bacterium]|jgi:hypothetical protein